MQRLTEELSALGKIPAEVAQRILEEYHQLTVTQEYLAQGGPEYTNRLLVKAFGDDGARPVQRVSDSHAMDASKVESLQKADRNSWRSFWRANIRNRGADSRAPGIQTSGHAADEVAGASPRQAVKRLAHLRQFSPEMAERVSVILNRRMQSLGDQERRTYGGFKSVAELMNRLDSNAAHMILETIEQEEPKLSLEIRSLMFTFDDFLQIPEQSLRELMGQVDKRALAVALKGASEELRTPHISDDVVAGGRHAERRDRCPGTCVRGKEVAKAQQEIVGLARKLESEGKLVLKNDGNDEYIV